MCKSVGPSSVESVLRRRSWTNAVRTAHAQGATRRPSVAAWWHEPLQIQRFLDEFSSTHCRNMKFGQTYVE